MKKLIIAVAVLSCAAPFMARADEPADPAAPVVAETLFADGTTNSWTQGDLVDALGLMNRKYWRDMRTADGRVKWHGKRLRQYFIDENGGHEGKGFYLVTLYEDGFAWTSTPTRVTIRDPEAKARAKAAEEALRAEWEAAHLPPEVAAVLAARREAAATTNEISVVVEAQ